MKTKHTPGPWLQQQMPSGNFDIFAESGDGQTIAQTPNEANANLIAAAPDMLRELEAALESVKNVPQVGETYDQQHSDTHMRTRLRLRSIIAKATGGE